ncbi:MAG: response regulator transcription factor [Rhodospirillales bacterium]|nr:response regulator transcription factor [Rhodospirillales bacterium]
MRIFLVEDNSALADGVSRALAKVGYAVDTADNGEDADAILATQVFDLVILDLNLPGCDGLEVLRRLRSRGNNAQVLILTARDALEDRVAGLDRGADDYLTKPFELAELEARVRALLRRSGGTGSPETALGGLRFNSVARRAWVNELPLDLPRRELGVLEILLNRAGHVVNKEQLADGLANFDDEISFNAIEIYVSRLRKRLKPAGLNIRTVRGLGYLMEKP